MSTIFGDLGNLGILVYIDDIVIASADIDSHLEKLSIVFDRLRQHNLKLKPSKCTFLSDKIQYLGFEIHGGKVAPINKNIEVIKNFTLPKSRKAVRSFLGTVSFYRKFIPDFSKRAINLINLTKDNGKFVWNTEAEAEFEDLKEALISKPCLVLPDFSKEFYLYSDASGEALGAVLSQMDENNFPHPVAFASRKLKDPETRYSTTERELLALVWATGHFKCYLANTHFYAYTDHAALTFMLKIHDPTSRMAKWICTLSDFNFTARYIKGKCNSVADFLSRFVTLTEENPQSQLNFCIQNVPEQLTIPQNDLLEKIREFQKSDAKCCQIVAKLDKNEEINPKYMRFYLKDDFLVCEDTRETNIMLKNCKLVVPKKLVPQVFALTHESLAACHQGHKKTLDRIREHFYWPLMSSHVKNLVDSCVSCQQRRAHKAKQLAPLQRMPTPQFPHARVHLDALGPFNTTFSGNKFILSYVDAFTKWPEAYAVSSISADVVAETLADYISRHGCPVYLVTDKGKNFLAEAIEKVYKSFGISHFHTSSYHPSSNGQVERVNRTVANALSHIVGENMLDWDLKLKFALLAIRTAVHSSTKLTPAVVMYGRNLNLPYSLFSTPPQQNYNDAPTFCELLIPALQKIYVQVHSNLLKAAESQENYREKSAVSKNIKIGDSVWLYTPATKPNLPRKFSKMNSGPFTVIEKISEVNFKISLDSKPSHTQVVHVDRLALVKHRMSFGEEDMESKEQDNEQLLGRSTPTCTEPTLMRGLFQNKRRRNRYLVIPPTSNKQHQNNETAGPSNVRQAPLYPSEVANPSDNQLHDSSPPAVRDNATIQQGECSAVKENSAVNETLVSQQTSAQQTVGTSSIQSESRRKRMPNRNRSSSAAPYSLRSRQK